MVAPVQPAQNVVEAVGLTKVFRDFWGRPKARAVNGIDFTVKRGQVFGLLGPNGSGKSTTVKMLLGLLYPSRGSLSVLGAEPRNVAIKSRIGYLPEESYLYRYLTAEETLNFFGALFEIPPDERRRRCDQLLGMVGLERSRHRAVGEFSKGMARRVGLAQALINDPDLVVLDEPTSGLDPIGCREVKDLIAMLAKRGKTVILSSHLLADVEDICDEVVILYGGKVQASGALKGLLAIQDKTRITVPKINDAQQDRVVALLREAVGSEQVTLDHPTMNLEAFFLEVVRHARETSVETSGAQSGGQIAEYLRGSGATGAELLAQLADTGKAAAPVAPAPAPVDVAKLARLADDAEANKPSTSGPVGGAVKPEAAAPVSAATAQQVNDRLKSLLKDGE